MWQRDEGLWDVLIDTLKEPTWGELESNAASIRLAARLGFVPVDRVFIFEPAWSIERKDAEARR